MTHPELALERILGRAGALAAEDAPLGECVDRVLADDIAVRWDVPAFDHAAADGYAVRCGDTEAASDETPVRLRLRDRLMPSDGPADGPEPGVAVPLTLGSPIPPGAEAVLDRAQAQAEGALVRVQEPVRPGARVRRRGEELRRGELLLARGARLRPYELALLAGQGYTRAPVIRRPRIAVISAGSELWEGDRTPPFGMVWNSNGALARAAIELWGGVPQARGLLPTESGPALEALAEALGACDGLVLTGGPGEGARDLAGAPLLRLGLEPAAWGLAIEPGSSFFFGICQGKAVFGLPGQASASLICLEEFIRPAIERMRGLPACAPSYQLQGRLEADFPKERSRQLYLLCEAREGPEGLRLRPLRPQGPAAECLARGANVIARVPIGAGPLRTGDIVACRWL